MNLKEARKQGKLEDFVKEHEVRDPEPDGWTDSSSVARMRRLGAWVTKSANILGRSAVVVLASVMAAPLAAVSAFAADAVKLRFTPSRGG